MYPDVDLKTFYLHSLDSHVTHVQTYSNMVHIAISLTRAFSDSFISKQKFRIEIIQYFSQRERFAERVLSKVEYQESQPVDRVDKGHAQVKQMAFDEYTFRDG